MQIKQASIQKQRKNDRIHLKNRLYMIYFLFNFNKSRNPNIISNVALTPIPQIQLYVLIDILNDGYI